MLWAHNYPGIHVSGDQAFLTATFDNLNTIESQSVGKNLLTLISKRCQGIGTKLGTERSKAVIIKYTNNINRTSQSPMMKDDRDVARDSVPGSIVRLPGVGTGSLVLYGHDMVASYSRILKIMTPPFVALAHELVHALHSLSGDFIKAYSWTTDGALIEEARTVGIGPYKGQTISENRVRKEHNLPLRTYYDTPGDVDTLAGIT